MFLETTLILLENSSARLLVNLKCLEVPPMKTPMKGPFNMSLMLLKFSEVFVKISSSIFSHSPHQF
jgi:hypothetical protein